MRHLKLILLSQSPVIEVGVTTMIAHENISVSTVSDTPSLLKRLDTSSHQSVVIADPMLLDSSRCNEIRCRATLVALTSSQLPQQLEAMFDNKLSIYDTQRKWLSVINGARDTDKSVRNENSDQPELTPREREIIVGVVKGLSNKEIAAEFNVSVNTVMTHRRNIASKLQIHSTAGLTIYAIMNKLVSMDGIDEHISQI